MELTNKKTDELLQKIEALKNKDVPRRSCGMSKRRQTAAVST